MDKDNPGKPKYLNYERAKEYCECKTVYAKSILGCKFQADSVHLPTREEFEQLSKYLGYDTSDGYSPLTTDGDEILPGLKDNWFWLLSPSGAGYAYVFDGGFGSVNVDGRYSTNAVLCVASY